MIDLISTPSEYIIYPSETKLSNRTILQREALMSNSKIFIVFYGCLLFTTIALIVVACNIPIVFEALHGIWQTFTISLCLSYFLSGLGLSLPIAIIGLGLSWIQFILLLTNKIDPHLEDKGFGSALKVIFTQLINLVHSKVG